MHGFVELGRRRLPDPAGATETEPGLDRGAAGSGAIGIDARPEPVAGIEWSELVAECLGGSQSAGTQLHSVALEAFPPFLEAAAQLRAEGAIRRPSESNVSQVVPDSHGQRSSAVTVPDLILDCTLPAAARVAV